MSNEIYDPTGVQKIIGGIIVGRAQGAHIGGSIGIVDYIANCINMTALTTGTLVASTLYAMPFVAPARGGVLDRIAAEVTTLNAGDNCNIGLYENKADQRDVYPGALLETSGSISVATTGIKSYGISRALVPGRIYWLAINLSDNTVFRCLAVGGVSAFLGMDTAGTTLQNCGISVASTFASAPMPDPYPAGGAYITAVPVPVLRYRFSA